MKMSKTNESGKFYFILDGVPETSGAIIQVFEKDRNDYILELDEISRPDFSKLTVSNSLEVHSKNKRDLENRSIANQIENNYYQQKKDSLLYQPKTAAFYHPLEKEYILDDYTRFPTLKETIVEILEDVYYTKNEQGYSIHLRDIYGQGNAYGESLVMMDGLMIQDVNELFDYDMQNIYKVSLVNRGYVYGPKVFNGVINFITKKSDFQTKASGGFIKSVTLDRPLVRKKYFMPDYTKKETERIPDYRYQLFWEPEVSLVEKETTLFFYSSDVKGMFEISIEGFTDKGDAVSIKKDISVE